MQKTRDIFTHDTRTAFYISDISSTRTRLKKWLFPTLYSLHTCTETHLICSDKLLLCYPMRVLSEAGLNFSGICFHLSVHRSAAVLVPYMKML